MTNAKVDLYPITDYIDDQGSFKLVFSSLNSLIKDQHHPSLLQDPILVSI